MNQALLLRWGLRHHAMHPLRTGLAVLGIALGVALFVGIHAALGSATAAFASAATTLVGRATHDIRGGPTGVEAAHLAAIATAPEVVASAPVSEGLGVGHAAGHHWRLRWFGCDPLVDGAVRPLLARNGTAAAAGGALALLAEPGAFAATSAMLARLHLAVGDAMDFDTGGHRHRARCVFALNGDASGSSNLDDVIVVDIATAQEWSGRPDCVDRVDVVLAEGVDVDAAPAALQARLPAPLRLVPVAGQRAFADLTAAFRTNLHALGMMALLVGAFLVHAAMRGAVASRQVEFALLRALGCGAPRLFLQVAKEAAVLGAVGSAIGCGLGIGAAHVLVAPLVQALNDHYASFSVHGVTVEPLLLVGAIALGTAVAVVAAVWPAREAAAAPPRAVFATAKAPHFATATAKWSLPLLGLGLLSLLQAGKQVAFAHAGLLLMLLAAAAVTPRFLELGLGLTARVLRRAGPWAAYVARSAAISRHRTGSAAAALVLAVAMATGLSTMIASFRDSVASWIDQALPADLYIGLPGQHLERQAAVLDPAIVEAVRHVPGVAAISTYRRFETDVAVGSAPAQPTAVLVLSPSPRVLAQMPFLGDGDAARAHFLAGDGALASEPLSFHRGIGIGDVVAIATETGVRSLPIVGIVRDYRSPVGELTVPLSWHGGRGASALAIEVAPGTDAEAFGGLIAKATSGGQRLDIEWQPNIKRQSLVVFDRTFAITAAMRLLCIVVAVLGIYGAFAALQLERVGEVGLLRALGAGPRHVALLVLGQTTLLGAWAGLLSLPVGIGLGYALVLVVNKMSFGWSLLEVEVPPSALGEAMLLAVGAAFVAGIEPAFRMLRTVPAAALREG